MQSKIPNAFPTTFQKPGSKGIIGELDATGKLGEFLLTADNVWLDTEGNVAPRPMFRQRPLLAGWNDIPYIDNGVSPNLPFASDQAGDKIFVVGSNGIYLHNGTRLESLPTGANPAPSTQINATNPEVQAYQISVSLLNNKYIIKTNYFGPGSGSLNIYDPIAGQYYGVTGGPINGWINLAAFNRAWQMGGNNTLYWSALSDPTDWTGAGSGSLDMNPYLTLNDRITGLAEFNGFLIVFSRESILIFQDPFTVPIADNGTPGASSTMSLREQIKGVGCTNHDFIANTGNDLIFLSSQGLLKLSRVLSEKGANPLTPLNTQLDGEFQRVLAYKQIYGYADVYGKLTYHQARGILFLTFQYEGTYLIYLNKPIDNNLFPTFRWPDIDTVSNSARKLQINAIYPFDNPTTGVPITNANASGYEIAAIVRDLDTTRDFYNGFAMAATPTLNMGILGYEVAPFAEDSYKLHIESPWLAFSQEAGDVESFLKRSLLMYRIPRKTIHWYSTQYVPDTPMTIDYAVHTNYSKIPLETKVLKDTDTTPVTEESFKRTYVGPMDVLSIPVEGNGNYFQWEIKATITDPAFTTFSIKQLGFQFKAGRTYQGQ